MSAVPDTKFGRRELYGGAITATLPDQSILLDASDLRQVPDHQEVFLARTSLMSVVVETNQRYEGDDGEEGADKETSDDDGEKLLNYYLHDIVDMEPERSNLARASNQSDAEEKDHLVDLNWKKIQMGDERLAGCPAFLAKAKVVRAPATATAAEAPAGVDREKGTVMDPHRASDATKTIIYLLLLRLVTVKTDICVFVYVPREEDANVAGGITTTTTAAAPDNIASKTNVNMTVLEQESLAEQILHSIVQTLRIEDWSLFNA